MANLVQSTREELLAKYGEALSVSGEPYSYKTIPYYCTAWAEFEVVNADDTHSFAYAVLRGGQELDFFGYGIGQRISAGGDEHHKANKVDTNLSKGNSTNGAFDFCIEAIGLHCKPARLEYPGLTTSADHSFVVDGQTIDADVLKALQGLIDIYDPTALATPQQLASPFFAGNVLWEALKNAGACAISFDGSYFRELGVAANFATGAEAHPWHNDSPPPDDLAMQIPEGFLWAKDGQPDSDCSFKIAFPTSVVVPISGIVHPGDGTTVELPTRIWLPVVCTLYGLEVGLTSSNG